MAMHRTLCQSSCGIISNKQITVYHDPLLLAGMHIVAMVAGYIHPLPAELVIALLKQVLLAVTSNGQVMCFEHNLRLL